MCSSDLAENGEYFHHIDVTPTICCQDYSKKVVKFKDINNDSLKFYHANSSLIEANTCCKFILNESFDDAISNVINLFYRFIPIIFNISREEAFRKLGHKGSNSRWGPQQQQRTMHVLASPSQFRRVVWRGATWRKPLMLSIV